MEKRFMLGFITICAFGAAVSKDVSRCIRQHEELKCVSECPPERTCRNKGVQFNCLQSNEKCQLKCQCKEGFYRNAVGECITEDLCDMCRGSHEYYSCGSFCDNECSQLHIQDRSHCPIVNIKCNEKCYCEDDYARDENNECIPIDQCQKV